MFWGETSGEEAKLYTQNKRKEWKARGVDMQLGKLGLEIWAMRVVGEVQAGVARVSSGLATSQSWNTWICNPASRTRVRRLN